MNKKEVSDRYSKRISLSLNSLKFLCLLLIFFLFAVISYADAYQPTDVGCCLSGFATCQETQFQNCCFDGMDSWEYCNATFSNGGDCSTELKCDLTFGCCVTEQGCSDVWFSAACDGSYETRDTFQLAGTSFSEPFSCEDVADCEFGCCVYKPSDGTDDRECEWGQRVSCNDANAPSAFEFDVFQSSWTRTKCESDCEAAVGTGTLNVRISHCTGHNFTVVVGTQEKFIDCKTNTRDEFVVAFDGLGSGSYVVTVSGAGCPTKRLSRVVVANDNRDANFDYGSPSICSADQGTIKGSVRSGSALAGSDRIDNAYVYLAASGEATGENLLTDEYGTFNFELMDAGTYTLTVAKTGYLTKSYNYVLSGGQVIDLNNITLYPAVSGSVRGAIRYENFTLVPENTGVLAVAGQTTVAPDASGIYVLSLPVGSYNVHAALTGYYSTNAPVVVQQGIITDAADVFLLKTDSQHLCTNYPMGNGVFITGVFCDVSSGFECPSHFPGVATSDSPVNNVCCNVSCVIRSKDSDGDGSPDSQDGCPYEPAYSSVRKSDGSCQDGAVERGGVCHEVGISCSDGIDNDCDATSYDLITGTSDNEDFDDDDCQVCPDSHEFPQGCFFDDNRWCNETYARKTPGYVDNVTMWQQFDLTVDGSLDKNTYCGTDQLLGLCTDDPDCLDPCEAFAYPGRIYSCWYECANLEANDYANNYCNSVHEGMKCCDLPAPALSYECCEYNWSCANAEFVPDYDSVVGGGVNRCGNIAKGTDDRVFSCRDCITFDAYGDLANTPFTTVPHIPEHEAPSCIVGQKIRGSGPALSAQYPALNASSIYPGPITACYCQGQVFSTVTSADNLYCCFDTDTWPAVKQTIVVDDVAKCQIPDIGRLKGKVQDKVTGLGIPMAHIYVKYGGDVVSQGLSVNDFGQYSIEQIILDQTPKSFEVLVVQDDYIANQSTVSIDKYPPYTIHDVKLVPGTNCYANPPPVVDFQAEALCGKKEIALNWSSSCDNIKYFILYRGDDRLDIVNSGVKGYIDTSVQWGQEYEYSIQTVYDVSLVYGTDQSSENITDIVQVSDVECTAERCDADTFCVGTEIYQCSIDGRYSFDEQCTDSGDTYICMGPFINGAQCVNRSICAPKSDNQFGLFYSAQECNSLSTCYSDYSRTIVDSCYDCKVNMSCYDYVSEAACNIDSCAAGVINNCIWKNLTGYQNIGAGICTVADYSGDDKCDLCYSANKPFSNVGCSFDVCNSLGSCFPNQGETACVACIDGGTCESYKDVLSCEGSGIDQSPFNLGSSCGSADELTYSNDSCGLGRCRWINDSVAPRCVKDGDANLIPDCLGPGSCRRDITPLRSSLVSGPDCGEVVPCITSNGGTFSFSTVDELLLPETAQNFYYCISAVDSDCCPDKTVSVSDLEVVFPNSDYSFDDLNQGEAQIRFFSEDKNQNVEAIRSMPIFIDTAAPTITLSENHYPNPDGTNTAVIDVELSEDAYCEDHLVCSSYNDIQFDGSVLSDQFSFTVNDMHDGICDYYIKCTDPHGNFDEQTKYFYVSANEYIYDQSPDLDLGTEEERLDNVYSGAVPFYFRLPQVIGGDEQVCFDISCSYGIVRTITDHAPTAPELVSPLHNEIVTGTEVILSWKNSIDADGDRVNYDLYFTRTTEGVAGPEISIVDVVPVISSGNVLNYSIQVNGSDEISWYVKAKDASNSILSEERTMYLSTPVSYAPSPPQIIGPLTNDIVNGRAVLKWASSTDPDLSHYQITVVKYDMQGSPVSSDYDNINPSGSVEQFEISVNDASKIKWRVTAVDSTGKSTASEWNTFFVREMVELAVNDPQDIDDLGPYCEYSGSFLGGDAAYVLPVICNNSEEDIAGTYFVFSKDSQSPSIEPLLSKGAGLYESITLDQLKYGWRMPFTLALNCTDLPEGTAFPHEAGCKNISVFVSSYIDSTVGYYFSEIFPIEFVIENSSQVCYRSFDYKDNEGQEICFDVQVDHIEPWIQIDPELANLSVSVSAIPITGRFKDMQSNISKIIVESDHDTVEALRFTDPRIGSFTTGTQTDILNFHLVAGPNEIGATGFDNAGNVNYSETIILYYDLEAPDLEIKILNSGGDDISDLGGYSEYGETVQINIFVNDSMWTALKEQDNTVEMEISSPNVPDIALTWNLGEETEKNYWYEADPIGGLFVGEYVQKPGNYSVHVTAWDKFGNSVNKSTRFEIRDTATAQIDIDLITPFNNSEGYPKVTQKENYEVYVTSSRSLQDGKAFLRYKHVDDSSWHSLSFINRTDNLRGWYFNLTSIPETSYYQGTDAIGRSPLYNAEFMIDAVDFSGHNDMEVEGQYFEIDTKGDGVPFYMPSLASLSCETVYVKDQQYSVSGFSSVGPLMPETKVRMVFNKTEVYNVNSAVESLMEDGFSGEVRDYNNATVHLGTNELTIQGEYSTIFVPGNFIQFCPDLTTSSEVYDCDRPGPNHIRYKIITASPSGQPEPKTVLQLDRNLESELYDKDMVYVYSEPVPTGWFMFNLSLGFAENNISINTIDEMGNVDPITADQTCRMLWYDNTSPELQIIVPQNLTFSSENHTNISIRIRDPDFAMSGIDYGSLILAVNYSPLSDPTDSMIYDILYCGEQGRNGTAYCYGSDGDQEVRFDYMPDGEEFPDGIYIIKFKGADRSGGAVFTDYWEFRVDSQLPSIPQFFLVPGQADSDGYWYTNDPLSNMTFNYTKEFHEEYRGINVTGVGITYYLPENIQYWKYHNYSAAFDVNLTVPLDDLDVLNKYDRYDVNIRVIKELNASHWSAIGSFSQRIIYDNIEPSVAFNSYKAIGTIENVVLRGSYDDSFIDVIRVFGDVTDNLGTLNPVVYNLTSGHGLSAGRFEIAVNLSGTQGVEDNFTVYAMACDKAGNCNTTDLILVYDVTPPSISLVNVSNRNTMPFFWYDDKQTIQTGQLGQKVEFSVADSDSGNVTIMVSVEDPGFSEQVVFVNNSGRSGANFRFIAPYDVRILTAGIESVHNITITAIDDAGNSENLSFTVNLDRKGPEISFDEYYNIDGVYYSDLSRPNISLFTSEAANCLFYPIYGAPNNAPMIPNAIKTEHWYRYDNPVSGQLVFSVVCSDPLGNTNAVDQNDAAAMFDLVVDTDIPLLVGNLTVPAIMIGFNHYKIEEYNTSFGLSVESTMNIWEVNGDYLKCNYSYDGEGNIVDLDMPVFGNQTHYLQKQSERIVYDTDNPNGNYKYTIRCEDRAHNQADPLIIDVAVDIGVSLEIISIEPNFTRQLPVQLVVMTNRNARYCEFFDEWDSGAQTWKRIDQSGARKYEINITSIEDERTYEVAVRCRNFTDGFSFMNNSFIYDLTPPAVIINSNSHSVDTVECDSYCIKPTNDPNVNISWAGSTDIGSGITGYVYDLKQSAGALDVKDYNVDLTTSHNFSNLADGIHYFYVGANDSAGNWNLSEHVKIEIDTQEPTAPVLDSLPILVKTNQINVSGRVTKPTGGAEAGAAVTIVMHNSTHDRLINVTTNKTGYFNVMTYLNSEMTTFVAYANDTAGNGPSDNSNAETVYFIRQGPSYVMEPRNNTRTCAIDEVSIRVTRYDTAAISGDSYFNVTYGNGTVVPGVLAITSVQNGKYLDMVFSAQGGRLEDGAYNVSGKGFDDVDNWVDIQGVFEVNKYAPCISWDIEDIVQLDQLVLDPFVSPSHESQIVIAGFVNLTNSSTAFNASVEIYVKGPQDQSEHLVNPGFGEGYPTSTRTDGLGLFDFGYTLNQGMGLYGIRVVAHDEFGSSTEPESSASIYYVDHGPNLTSLYPIDGAVMRNLSTVYAVIEKMDNALIVPSTVAGRIIEVSSGQTIGAEISECRHNSSCSYEMNITAYPLNDGDYEIRISAEDETGLLEEYKSSFSIDSKIPEIFYTEPASAELRLGPYFVSGTELQITAYIESDYGPLSAHYEINGGSYPIAIYDTLEHDYVFSEYISGLGLGSNIVVFVVNDSLGNSVSEEVELVIKPSYDPQIEIKRVAGKIADEGMVVYSENVSVFGEFRGIHTENVRRVKLTNGSENYYYTLVEGVNNFGFEQVHLSVGENSLIASLEDVWGTVVSDNVSVEYQLPLPDTYYVELDETERLTDESTIIVSGTVYNMTNDPLSGVAVHYVVNDALYGIVASNSSGQFKNTINLPVDGTYVITAAAQHSESIEDSVVVNRVTSVPRYSLDIEGDILRSVGQMNLYVYYDDDSDGSASVELYRDYGGPFEENIPIDLPILSLSCGLGCKKYQILISEGMLTTEGTYTLKVDVANGLGNLETYLPEFVISENAPIILFSSPNEDELREQYNTPADKLNILGTIESESPLVNMSYRVNGGVWHLVMVIGDVQQGWSFSAPVDLVQFKNTIQFRVVTVNDDVGLREVVVNSKPSTVPLFVSVRSPMNNYHTLSSGIGGAVSYGGSYLESLKIYNETSELETIDEQTLAIADEYIYHVDLRLGLNCFKFVLTNKWGNISEDDVCIIRQDNSALYYPLDEIVLDVIDDPRNSSIINISGHVTLVDGRDAAGVEVSLKIGTANNYMPIDSSVITDSYGNFMVENYQVASGQGMYFVKVQASDGISTTNEAIEDFYYVTEPPMVRIYPENNDIVRNITGILVILDAVYGTELDLQSLDIQFRDPQGYNFDVAENRTLCYTTHCEIYYEPVLGLVEEGKYQVWVSVKDSVFGHMADEIVEFTVDPTVPEVVFVSPSEFPYYHDQQTIKMRGQVLSLYDVISCEYQVNSVDSFDCGLYMFDGELRFDNTVNLDPGHNTIEYFVTNDRGSMIREMVVVNTPDSFSPSVVIEDVNGKSAQDGMVVYSDIFSISGRIENIDAAHIEYLRVSVGNYSDELELIRGQTTFAFSDVQLSEGENNISITLRDKWGREVEEFMIVNYSLPSNLQYEVILDSLAGLTKDADVTVSGIVYDSSGDPAQGVTINYLVNGQADGSAVSLADGTFGKSVALASDGQYLIHALPVVDFGMDGIRDHLLVNKITSGVSYVLDVEGETLASLSSLKLYLYYDDSADLDYFAVNLTKDYGTGQVSYYAIEPGEREDCGVGCALYDITVADTLSDGDYVLEIYANNSLGVESHYMPGFKILADAPVITLTDPLEISFSPWLYVFDSPFYINGSIVSSAGVENHGYISVNSGSPVPFPIRRSGQGDIYFEHVGVLLDDGENHLQLKVTDLAGRESVRAFTIVKASINSNLLVTIANPQIGRTLYYSAQPIEGTYSGDYLDHLTVSINGSVVHSYSEQELEALNGGYTVMGNLVEGLNCIDAVLSNKFDQSITQSVCAAYDDTKPDIVPIGMQDPLFTKNPDQLLSVTITSPMQVNTTITRSNSSLHEILVKSEITVGTNKIDFIPHLDRGHNIIHVVSSDDQGNISNDERNIILDQTVPVLTVLGPQNGSSVNDPEITVWGGYIDYYMDIDDGETDSIENITIIVDNPEAAGTSIMSPIQQQYSGTVVLGQGDNKIVVSAFDKAGNVNSKTVFVNYDNVDPNIEITGMNVPAGMLVRANNGQWETNSRTVFVIGSYDEANLASIKLYVDGVQQATAESENSLFNVTLSISGSLFEEKNITVRLFDSFGNFSEASAIVVYDGQAPDIDMVSLNHAGNYYYTSETLPNISVVTDEISSCNISYRPKGFIGVNHGMQMNGNGTYHSVTLNQPLYNRKEDQSKNGITVTCSDAFSNSAQLQVPVYVDQEPPRIESLKVYNVYEINGENYLIAYPHIQLEVYAIDDSGMGVRCRYNHSKNSSLESVDDIENSYQFLDFDSYSNQALTGPIVLENNYRYNLYVVCEDPAGLQSEWAAESVIVDRSSELYVFDIVPDDWFDSLSGRISVNTLVNATCEADLIEPGILGSVVDLFDSPVLLPFEQSGYYYHHQSSEVYDFEEGEEYSYRLSCRDPEGIFGAREMIINFTVDTTKPTLSLYNPPSYSVSDGYYQTSSSLFVLNTTARDANLKAVEVYMVDDELLAGLNPEGFGEYFGSLLIALEIEKVAYDTVGTTVYNVSEQLAFGTGVNWVTVMAYDKAGNTETQLSVVNFSNNGPRIISMYPNGGILANLNQVRATLMSTDSDGLDLEGSTIIVENMDHQAILGDYGHDGYNRIHLNVTVPDGDYKIIVIPKDDGGDVGPAEVAFVSVRAGAPSFVFSSPQYPEHPSVTNKEAYWFNGTISGSIQRSWITLNLVNESLGGTAEFGKLLPIFENRNYFYISAISSTGVLGQSPVYVLYRDTTGPLPSIVRIQGAFSGLQYVYDPLTRAYITAQG